MSKQVKCKSGATGWEDKLKNVYSTFQEFVSYCEIYGIHERIGFSSMKKAWATNPIIQGSTNPADLRRVK